MLQQREKSYGPQFRIRISSRKRDEENHWRTGASATSSWRPAQMIPENPIAYGTEFDRGSSVQFQLPARSPRHRHPGAAATDATATPYTAPASYTAPATATAAPAAAAPAAAAAPQMISRAALYELQKQNAINSYEASKAQQIANLRSQGYSDRQLPTAPTNWGKVTQPANWESRPIT
jgi:hypothetical protein